MVGGALGTARSVVGAAPLARCRASGLEKGVTALRAILSVYDKSSLVELARGLAALGAELYSTGGTMKALAETGVAVRSISDLTGFPEILDGRVKTLHPKVYGGILARRELADHQAQLKAHAIAPIDLVAVNLYPFVSTVTRPGVGLEEALENIDIGGPTMLRAAAKNFPDVLVLVDPADYGPVVAGLKAGAIAPETRRRLAAKAFAHVAAYDAAVAAYLRGQGEGFPEELSFGLRKLQDLRYGENPHQRAAFYADVSPGVLVRHSVTWARQLQGKELSYNNILDLDSALGVVTEFEGPTIAIVKHNNPCGLATHERLAEAYRRAFAGDPVSAFGGIVACNTTLDLETAEAMAPTFFEAVIAPDFAPAALERFKRKRDLRVLATGPAATPSANARYLDVRRVRGGFLVQTPDSYPDDGIELKTATARAPTSEEVADLRYAWKIVKHIKSNGIVLARDRALLGMGAGQPNRVTSVKLAVERAGVRARGSVLASDAFFPFPDGVEAAAAAGVTAIIQPGGSIRDQEIIAAADKAGMAMVLTGVRHFKH